MQVKKITSNSVDFLVSWKNGKIDVSRINAKEEVTKVTCAAVSTDEQESYFVLEDGNNDKYYVWLNVNDSGSDPAPDDSWTGVEVAVADDDTDSAVATAVSDAIDALDEFSASSDSEVVTITNATAGATEDGAYDENTGFDIEVDTKGLDSFSNVKSDSPWNDVVEIYDVDIEDAESANLYAAVRVYKETKEGFNSTETITREYSNEYRTVEDWFSPS